MRKALTTAILATIAALCTYAQTETPPMTLSRAEKIIPRPALKPVASLDRTVPAGVSVIDTIDTSNPSVKIVLFSDNTWKLAKDGDEMMKDPVFINNWNDYSIDPYHIDYSKLPNKEIIWLVDSLGHYHYPAEDAGRITSKYGRRHGRYHRGVDIAQPKGTNVYATFDGKVRISKYMKGYGNFIAIRHENGLETLYGHLTQRNFKEGDWVEAGQIIGLTGSTGRSTGPHLHYEVRYNGYAIDPEWMIDFSTQQLHHQILVIKKKMLFPDSKFVPESDEEEDEIADADERDRLEAERLEAEMKAAKYHTIKSGDTLGRIAINNGTTVSALCKLNGITPKTTLRIGRKIRVK